MTRTQLLTCALASGSLLICAAEPFGFLGPEMQRVEGQARALLAADIDQDGGLDAVFLNNGKARIEILYQRKPGSGKNTRSLPSNRWEPELQDSRFERDSITTGSLMYELAAGDLNGDGKIDLACTEDSRGLLVYYQGQHVHWEDPIRIELKDPATYQGTLLITDVNGDGRQELIVVAHHELHIYEPEKNGHLTLKESLPAANEDPYNLQVRDLDADGRLDLMYLNPVNDFALRVRIQTPDGHFGPEEVIAFDRPSGLIQPYPNGKDAGFVAVNRNNGQLEHFALVQRPPKEMTDDLFSLQAYAYRASDSDKPMLHTWNDLNEDGTLDLITAAPGASQLSVYQNVNGSLQSPVDAPSYSGIVSLSPIHIDGKQGVLLASPGEETWGVSSWKAPSLAFPRPLDADGKPVASASAGPLRVAVLQKEKSYVLFTQEGDQQHTHILNDLKDDPERIHLMDINQDGRVDVLLETPYKPLAILIKNADDGYEQLDTDSGSSRSLLSRLDPGTLAFADLDRDGKNELIIVRKGFVRAVRLDADGQFETVSQINASNPDMKIAAAIHMKLGDTWQMILVDKDKHRLELHQTHPPVPRMPARTFELPDSPVVSAELVQLSPDTDPELILHGKKLFWRLSADRPRWQVQRVSRYETDLPEMRYGLTAIGDLNHDMVPDILGIDQMRTHLLEILSYQKESWKSEMHFKIFESDRPGSQGQQGEPREILLDDFTSDGRTDIMILIHDRMLLYPQDQ
ncbi:MAG: hypothetical protein ACI9TH_004477 [Kiritimatiellia bacterium]|jgi:hypothetical protein